MSKLTPSYVAKTAVQGMAMDAMNAVNPFAASSDPADYNIRNPTRTSQYVTADYGLTKEEKLKKEMKEKERMKQLGDELYERHKIEAEERKMLRPSYDADICLQNKISPEDCETFKIGWNLYSYGCENKSTDECFKKIKHADEMKVKDKPKKKWWPLGGSKKRRKSNKSKKSKKTKRSHSKKHRSTRRK